jgi:hypothetical protein
MNLKLQVYENGYFIKDEIEWIEKTPETLQAYIDKTYEWEEPWMHDDGAITDEEINGLHQIARIEKGFDKYITVYQYFQKYDYLVQIEYGEDTYYEWYACRDFKALLAFLKELEPLLNLIEQNATIGCLEVISDTMASILNPESYDWIKDEKVALEHILADFKEIENDFKKWIEKTKRKKFTLNGLTKEIIKSKRRSSK